MPKHVFRKKRRGFNAIELVVVVLVVFMVIGVFLVFLRSMRNVRGGDGNRSINSLKQLSLSANNFNCTHKKLPPAYDQFKQMTFPVSVHVHLLPFLEGDKLYQTILATRGQRGTDEVVWIYFSTTDSTVSNRAGVQNFAANLRVFSDKGVATPFDGNMAPLGLVEPGTASLPKTCEDGTSNTILFSMKFAECGDGGSRYAAPPNSPFAAFFGQNAAQARANATDRNVTFQIWPSDCHTSPLMAQSPMKEGIYVSMADGSVRFINATVSPRTWNQLVQPNDGMAVGPDWQ
jgi:hypothetical protein